MAERKLSEALERSLILAAVALAARPRELRGPFIVNHELVERIARSLLSERDNGK